LRRLGGRVVEAPEMVRDRRPRGWPGVLWR